MISAKPRVRVLCSGHGADLGLVQTIHAGGRIYGIIPPASHDALLIENCFVRFASHMLAGLPGLTVLPSVG